MVFLQGTKQHLTLWHGRVRGADGCKLYWEETGRRHSEGKCSYLASHLGTANHLGSWAALEMGRRGPEGEWEPAVACRTFPWERMLWGARSWGRGVQKFSLYPTLTTWKREMTYTDAISSLHQMPPGLSQSFLLQWTRRPTKLVLYSLDIIFLSF